MQEKVLKLLERLEEVEELLGKPEVITDQGRFRSLSQEHSQLAELRDAWKQYASVVKQLKENRQLAKEETDPELSKMVDDEIDLLEGQVEPLMRRVESLLVPPDPRDSRDIIVELRAGTGGEEAALFVADCVRMYQLYADHMKWGVDVLSCTLSDLGGYKDFVMGMKGKDVFRFMQYEAGTHRVQRVPKTETQGRVHTSAITIAVLLEPDEEDQVQIDEKDLRIDTFRSSGAGGQHVNTTDSAVRITHIPTGVVVACQEERSQHKNKDKAMRLLKAKIAEEQQRKAHAEMSGMRSAQIGSGDRSERIRTYNFPQNRVTDHRIDMTLYKLDQVMQGDLDQLSQALVSHYYQEKLHS